MGCVYHVHCFHLGRKFLLPSCARRPGFLVVIAMQSLFLVFSIQLIGLFEYPTFSVGVVGRFIGGAMNLTRAIKYAVQTGRARIVSFECLFPLTRLRATESGIDGRVFGIIATIATLVFVASGLVVAVFGLRDASFACSVIATG